MAYTHYNRYFSQKDLADRLQFEVMKKYGINARSSAANQVAANIRNGEYSFTVAVLALKALEHVHRDHSS